MYRSVVVPLDGSKLAEVALPYAEELAAKMACEIILFSVLEAPESTKHHSYATKIKEVTKRHSEKYLEKSNSKAVEVVTATRRGNPAEAIVEYVGKGPFYLIVMATHGRSGITRWAVGSVADKIVKANSRQPVLLIRAKAARSDVREKRILKKALLPLDGSIRSRAVMPYITEMASKLEMELTLLQVVPSNNNVYKDAERYLQDMCSMIDGENIKVGFEVRVGTAADEIIDCADELAVDVVAMSTHGKTGIGLWPLGSVAQKVLLAGNTPLLLVKD